MEQNQVLDMANRTSKMNRFLMEHHEDDMIIAIALQDVGSKIKVETAINGKGDRKNIALALSDVIAEIVSDLPKPIQFLTIMELNDRMMGRLEKEENS